MPIKMLSKAYTTLSSHCRLLAPFRMYAASSFKAADLKVQRTTAPREMPDMKNLKFGHNFSDHMLVVPWKNGEGWGQPVIKPLENFSLHPACKVFHYANELFEGMKAYRWADGQVCMFRPDMNMKRMKKSAIRATLPTFDGDELIKCMKALISLDKRWVPDNPESSLYIRPTMIGVDPSLGVEPPEEVLLFVITGPVGAYYPTGMKPISLLADPAFVRAWKGGSGDSKMGANYAPTTFVQLEARRRGCQQVLWLLGDDHHLTEVGTMNIFVHWINEQGELECLTPPLDGTILPGVTRDSVLEIMKDWKEFKVSEAPITMKQITKAVQENRLKEIFGCGTACVVSQVERIHYGDQDYAIPCGNDSLAVRLLKEVTDIQYGRSSARSKWIEVIGEADAHRWKAAQEAH